jgi:hypothetical protein
MRVVLCCLLDPMVQPDSRTDFAMKDYGSTVPPYALKVFISIR